MSVDSKCTCIPLESMESIYGNELEKVFEKLLVKYLTNLPVRNEENHHFFKGAVGFSSKVKNQEKAFSKSNFFSCIKI